jgi:prepilin-type N-terminal cleavage/methylation domain-containing protein
MKRSWVGAFTLVELIIVMAIIAILAVALLAGINPITQMKRTRDSARKAELGQVQNAMEQYFADHAYLYPSDDCTLAKGYMKSGSLPDDGFSYSCPTDGTTYCVCAKMEMEEGGNYNSDASVNCDSANLDPGGEYFCLSNLQ